MTDKGISQPDALCPACGRFIGPAAECPYCGTDGVRAGPRGVLRVAVLLLAVLGLLFLYLMGAAGEVRLVDIRDIGPTMNFATVRVRGTVARKPYVSRRDGKAEYLSFLVDDGTGALRVAAQDRTARALDDGDLVPARGTAVQVTGSLRVRGDGDMRMRLLSAAHLRIADAARD